MPGKKKKVSELKSLLRTPMNCCWLRTAKGRGHSVALVGCCSRPVKRMVFHEITADIALLPLHNPGVDTDLVGAQKPAASWTSWSDTVSPAVAQDPHRIGGASQSVATASGGTRT